jgi:hypothetical protein
MLKIVKQRRSYKTSAWKELDIHVCSKNHNIPTHVKNDPLYTLKPGEELKLNKYMCELMDSDNKQEYPHHFMDYPKPIQSGFNESLDKNYILHPDEYKNFFNTIKQYKE